MIIAFLAAASAAYLQVAPAELRWVGGGTAETAGGALRCQAGQEHQLSVQGEDSADQRVPLDEQTLQITSSDQGVVHASLVPGSEGLVNVRCVADGQASLTAAVGAVRGEYAVLVGAGGQVGLSRPQLAIAPGTKAQLAQSAPTGRLERNPAPTPAMRVRPGVVRQQPLNTLALAVPSVTIPLVKGRMIGRLEGAGVELTVTRGMIAPQVISLKYTSGLQISSTQDNLPEGAYRVRLAVTRANRAGSLQLVGNGGQSTCALTQQSSYSGPVQTCEFDPVQVASDGKLSLTASVVGNAPSDWMVSEVTVSRLPQP